MDKKNRDQGTGIRDQQSKALSSRGWELEPGTALVAFAVLSMILLACSITFAADPAPGTDNSEASSQAMVSSKDQAGTPVPAKEKIRKGETSGEVLQVRGGPAAQVGIATAKNDEYFILDPKARLQGVSKLSEIKRGDTVKVRYEEKYLEDDQTPYRQRIVKEIIFLKKSEPVVVAPVPEQEKA